MSGATHALREALAWAAGRPGPAPREPAELDPERFVRLLDEHGLDGRFLLQTARSGVSLLPDEELAAVRERHRATRDLVHDQMRVARALESALRERDPDCALVVLKGHGLYALTGRDHTLRRSRDLDLMARDPDGLIEVARRWGYREAPDHYHPSEYAVLVSDGLPILELHSYVAVLSAPPADCTPGRHPGPWRHPGPFGIAELRHEHVAGRLAAGLPSLPTASLPSPELGVIVHAAHLFNDHVIHLLPRPAAAARLGEVATIVDLCALPAFRRDRLAELTALLAGDHVVAFARRLAIDLLHVDPLAGGDEPTPPEAPPRAPRDLWWDGRAGLPVDLRWDPAQLVLRDTTANELLAEIGASRVAVPVAPDSVILGALTGGEEDLPRVISRTSPDVPFDVRGSLARDCSHLDLTLSVPGAADHQMTGVSLNFGDRRHEFFYRPASSHLRQGDYSNVRNPDRDVSGAARREGGRDVFHVRLAWEAAGAEAGAGAPIPLLLGIRRQDREWGSVSAEVILPVELEVTGRRPEPG